MGGENGIGQRLVGGTRRHVDGTEGDPSPARKRSGGRRAIDGIDIGDGDKRAFLGQAAGDAGADALRLGRPDHDRHLVLHASHRRSVPSFRASRARGDG